MKLPRSPKAVVFDLDGTLIDSEALVKDAFQTVCGRFGAEMTDAQFLSLVGLHRAANDVQLLALYGQDFPLEDFHLAAKAHVGERSAPLKPGALDVLDALDEMRLPYGLATSSRPHWVERHFTTHALTTRFRAVVTRDDVTDGKPHPEPYLKAASLLGMAPADVLALEDSHPGVRSAHAAGCMTVMVPDLLAADDEMHTKALVVASLRDVLPLLR